LVDASADSALELSKPIDLSDHKAWYDIETSCYVDKELLLGLEPEQEGLAVSTPVHDYSHSRYHSPRPSHDRTGQYHDNRNAQRTLKEPASYSLPKPLDKDGAGSEGNLSELERDMLLALEEQEKSSSATAPSSAQPPRGYTKQSHPWINQEHDQGRTLKHGSPLPNQD
jgi:hypothetical protein